MSDQLLVVLRVCLLALVYLVFLRVLRAVWVELRSEQGLTSAPVPTAVPASSRSAPVPGAPGPRRPPSGVAAPAGRLVIVAPPALAGRSFTLEAETTIGRAPGCGVPIDDAHVSKLHARIFFHDGSWLIEDLGSTNGTLLDGRPVTGPTPLGSGSRVTVGEIELELT